MVRELEKVDHREFPETAPTANPVFYRTYSRKTENGRETWVEVCDRTINGLRKLGQLTPEETDLLYRMQSQLKAMSSGRWLWVGGTEWITQPQNFSGAYNCSSTNIMDWRAFGLLMDLAMMGCGTGAVLEGDYINQLPPIRNHLNLILRGEIGSTPAELRRELTELKFDGDQVEIYVGDSRQGWVGSYQALLELSTDERFSGEVKVIIDLSDVRPAGEQLKGFGGVANPVKLPDLYQRCGNILNQAIGRQLNSVECCLLIDEAAVTIVAGNIRRCLPEGALVHTASGLVPIEKIRIGDRVLTSKGFYPVTNFFVQGTQSLCRIQTEDGYFECTADHKVAVLQDLYGNYKMIKAKDLQEGDRLIFVPQAIPGTPTELPELKGVTSHGAKAITVPALTNEVAYFLGYLHGDGSVASDGWQVRFWVPQDSPEILERLINVAQEFGLETHTLRTPEQCKTKAYELQLNSSILNKYLSQFKQSFTSITIPDCILMGTTEIRQAYLAGLADADGCHSQGVLVASVYQDFLQQVQALYASLGITTRLCGSVRKRTGKWEGELVTVGESAFEAVEKVMMTYSTQFPEQKRKRPKFFHDHGFPREMAQPLVNTFDWNKRKQMMVRIVKNLIADATDLIPVKVKKVEMDVREASTYDIEVASIHEFVCQGILVANSAGMRQGNSSDRLFAVAKDNLWRQDEDGNWGIDPNRDALRMANHTHVFHHKPTLEECVEAVRKQFYSGEGAIQWAGEAVARANRDLLSTTEIKRDFLKAYGEDNAKKWFQEHYPNISNDELEHRLARLGLNPCHSGDTLVSTDQGLIPIQDLVGKQFKALVDLRSVGLSGVKLTDAIAFATGVKTTYKIMLTNGMQMRCTADHQHFTSRGWVSTQDLTNDDNIYVQRGAGYFGKGTISVAQAQMLGWWYGDGYNVRIKARSNGHGRKQDHFAKGFVFNQDEYETANNIVGKAVASITGREYVTTLHKGVYEFRTQSPKLEKFFADLDIVGKEELPNNFLSQSQEVLIGFLQGIFSADGTVDKDSRRIKLAMVSEKLLQQIQLILSNLGIISTVRLIRKEGYRGVPYTTVDGTEKISLDRGSYGLFISTFNFNLFQELIGFPQSPSKNIKAEKWLKKPLPNYCESTINSKFTSKVKKVEEFGEEVVYDLHVPLTNSFIANGCLTHNCGEIIGSNFHCNLSEIHLNQIDPNNHKEQEEAFTAGALSVATLLNHKFLEPRYNSSRELDPIVGVSFTGLFDFFVKAFGIEWLHWWQAGRPATIQGLEFKQKEAEYLTRWREIVHQVVWDYCDRHNLKRPNRCTTVQPSGTKSLLTNAAPGWHPPFGLRWVRRITFAKNDPVALACLDYGYSVIPGQSSKDENGNLLNDPFDDRAKEWLVEIPVQVSWIDLPGVEEIAIEKFSATSMFDFYMGVQKHWTTHNSSSTILLTEAEIEPLGTRIYEAIRDDEGYISSALLARFDAPFPRLPFERISQEEYEKMQGDVLQRRKSDNFSELMNGYVLASELPEIGPQDPACSGMVCELKGSEPQVN
ncbi:MAG: ribonucleoside-triphosphate reductase, adenosylcobalamin-dependent [Okeania sp. SIO2G4]|uniref:ribonucleoside-triphosphate reductase, adenosylcobalamin-dependent n=1 Tax=unclassified Okeania TaxID=2634635 RepID=UPI0013BE6768|nr:MULTISPECIES: ribonucleoside-triphosphate reductase, adenosylcobalamin-dependent [unclassified Okeania]NEP03749.1 ribonucleoside-triphosphate reductase, adenosylcobalamin-dependent [Okeania sp. SIO4D6]NEP38177.1 ribonucleoside-triphosphate reductase, adenosylcobalamin-dependent [Okeania sp. SIO2H7]NEP70475.1 ribonucleoside-triphosphate reductase, adenosylcobalamin-dependent [Okeania sp. SIO2G5]NEP92677.1 ribonucleoside-triphosphate reductase, adenosylcobalamin-dependent [Okeania sp. SIO2F5]